jgi:ribosomal protein L29
MAKKNVSKEVGSDLKSVKMEAMRIRFRRVLGEGVSPHIVRGVRKSIAKCAMSLSGSGKVRGKNV